MYLFDQDLREGAQKISMPPKWLPASQAASYAPLGIHLEPRQTSDVFCSKSIVWLNIDKNEVQF